MDRSYVNAFVLAVSMLLGSSRFACADPPAVEDAAEKQASATNDAAAGEAKISADLPQAEPAQAQPAQPSPRDVELIAIEQNIVEHTNRQRARHGLPRLNVDKYLMSSARRHATWMARNRVLRHTSASVAENIAAGQSHSTEAVNDWMSSSGHRANILSRGHRRIGVAAFRGRDGQIYWCQQFLQ